MIRNQEDYNQIRLFIRYIIGRKSPQKLIAYIKEQLSFHERIELANTPDGITLKVIAKHGDIFVPLGEPSDPTCIVYLSLIGISMFAASLNTYGKRIDLVKHLRLQERKPIKPELNVLIPNMAPYIKRLNERLGYKAILNKKIGREAGYFFETANFRGNMLIPYYMNKRKFTCSWDKGSKVIFFTNKNGPWKIAEELNKQEVWTIPAYSEKEIKAFTGKYKPGLILYNCGQSEADLFGNTQGKLKEQKLPVKYVYINEQGVVEMWDEEEKDIFNDINLFCSHLKKLTGKTGEKKQKKEEL